MKVLGILFLAVLALLLVACGPSANEIASQIEQTIEARPPIVETAISELEVTRIVEVEVTRAVEVTRIIEVEITNTPAATATPQIIVATPTAAPLPEQFIELTGNGDTVTDNFVWGVCDKAVFYSSDTSSGGNFIVYLHRLDEDNPELIANVIAPEPDTSLSQIESGTYYLEIEAPSSGNWTIRGECQDSTSAVASAPALVPLDSTLEELIPEPENFPDNLEMATAREYTTLEIANGSDDPAQRLEELQDAGRITGYGVTYYSTDFCDTRRGIYDLFLEPVLFETAAGAQQEWERSSRIYSAYEDSLFEFFDLGDKAFRYLYTGPVSFDPGSFPLNCAPPAQHSFHTFVFTRSNVLVVMSIRGVQVTQEGLFALSTELAETVDNLIINE